MKYLNESDNKRIYSLIKDERYDNDGLLNRVKNFIHNNPDDELSENLRSWAFENIKYAFTNPYLERAFDIPKEYKYTRKAEIYKYLPFMSNNTMFRTYFAILFLGKKNVGGPKKFYNACKSFCNKYYKNQIPDIYFNRIFEAIKEYEINSFSSKENGLTFEENEGVITGKCGEYSVVEWLKTYPGRTTYVSKECAYNFGFDVLYDDPKYDLEVLVEVKSTKNSFDNDGIIILTQNENNTLEGTKDLKKTEYVIIRVFIDKKTKEKTYLILYYDSKNKLFYNDENPYYRIEYRNKGKNNAGRTKYSKVLIPKENKKD